MKEFTRQNLKSLRLDIDKALESVNKKHGIALSIGNIRFDALTFHTKMSAVVVNPSDIIKAGITAIEAVGKVALEQFGDTYGFKPDQYGRTFTLPNSTGVYKFLGLKPSAPKNKVLFEKVGGGKYHCSVLYSKQFKWQK